MITLRLRFVNTWYWLKTIEFRVELNVFSWRDLWNSLLKNFWNFPISKYYWFVWMCLCFYFLISVFDSENASHICYYAIDIVQLDKSYYLFVYIFVIFLCFLLLYNNHWLFHHKVIQDFHLILEWVICRFTVYGDCDIWYVQRVLPELLWYIWYLMHSFTVISLDIETNRVIDLIELV